MKVYSFVEDTSAGDEPPSLTNVSYLRVGQVNA